MPGEGEAKAWEQDDWMSKDAARTIDEKVKHLTDLTYAETGCLLEEHRQQVDDLAQALPKSETLNAEEVDKIMKGEPLQKATVSDLLQAEKERVARARAEFAVDAPTWTPTAEDLERLEKLGYAGKH